MGAVTILMLEVLAASSRYYIPRSHVDQLETLRPIEVPLHDQRGRPVVVRDLAGLFGQTRNTEAGRWQALSVVLRRRTVMFLVDRVESLVSGPAVLALPRLLQRRLAFPWVSGTVMLGETPTLVLDLRRIAADVALGVADQQ